MGTEKDLKRFYFLCEDKRTKKQIQVAILATNPERAENKISKLIYYNVTQRLLEKPKTGMIYSLNQLEKEISEKYKLRSNK